MRLIASALIAATGLSVGLGQAALAADLPQRPVYNPCASCCCGGSCSHLDRLLRRWQRRRGI